jgi:hypothetical protein|tara:strand:- start:286 stop:507 length:222 start_codon:yes stop_codon:yes gene_type:complete
MYRIIREENKLSGRIVYIIEKRKVWLWMESWTRDLGLDITVTGPIGAPTLDGAKYKLKLIKDNDGRMTHSEVV